MIRFAPPLTFSHDDLVEEVTRRVYRLLLTDLRLTRLHGGERT
jgi:hypothetical protein